MSDERDAAVDMVLASEGTAKRVLGAIGLVWLGLGMWGIFDPTSLADTVDLTATSSLGTLEVRAMYGGMCVALGAQHFTGVLYAPWRGAAIGFSALQVVGLASGRLLAMAAGNDPGLTGALLLATEFVMVGALTWAAWQLRLTRALASQAAKAVG